MPKTRHSMAEWRKLLSEWEASGQTQEQWCIEHGINLYTMRDRSRKLRQQDNETNAASVSSHRSTTEIPKSSEWVMVETESQSQVKSSPVPTLNNELIDNELTGKLTISFEKFQLTADAFYPTTALSALLKELTTPHDARREARQC